MWVVRTTIVAISACIALIATSAPQSNAASKGTLPSVLTLSNGTKVTSAAVWEKQRRPELINLFRQNIYGVPLPKPTKETFSVKSSASGNVTRKIVTINITGPYGSKSFPLTLFVPKTKPKGTFLLIDHRGQASQDPNSSSGYFPTTAITSAGYAAAFFNANDVAPDNGDSYRNGMINLFYKSSDKLPANAPKDIGAWAWGASRAMDYLQTDTSIDHRTIAVIGHSRSGKASLWAGAQDSRFAAVISNDSGSTGAKLARWDSGESVSSINGQFPYWFAGNYTKYNDNEAKLPVDQHELLALVAPRRVVVASAEGDDNAAPPAEFASFMAAQPAYKLYGLSAAPGLPTSGLPKANVDYRGTGSSYHLRSGGHDLDQTDWNFYIKGNLFTNVQVKTAAAPVKPATTPVKPATTSVKPAPAAVKPSAPVMRTTN